MRLAFRSKPDLGVTQVPMCLMHKAFSLLQNLA